MIEEIKLRLIEVDSPGVYNSAWKNFSFLTACLNVKVSYTIPRLGCSLFTFPILLSTPTPFPPLIPELLEYAALFTLNKLLVIEQAACLLHYWCCVPVCVPACLSACLPACLSVCLPVCLSVCLPACLCACLPV